MVRENSVKDLLNFYRLEPVSDGEICKMLLP